ncbi:MAG: hypothetical protein O2962_05700 [Cyanobacteria bacterium]|nr:hypothetical protein [Cyanobacteriota bacterium]
MELIEELNRIKLANRIINQDSAKLGIRPITIGELLEHAEPIQQKTEYKPEPREIKTEAPNPQAKIQIRHYLKAALPGLVLITVLIVGYALFAFLTNHETNKVTKLTKATTATAATTTRGLVITSGNFQNATTAERYRLRLARKLGVDLKVIKDGSQFTVQIGPNYKNKEDAIVVFDELSRYSVNDLSLRLDRV